MIANLEAATIACDETLARTGSQQYLLEQTIRYSYRGSVTDLRQRLIVVPRERHGDQHRVHYAVTTSAPGARRHEHIDEFGNVVTDVHVDVVHDAIEFEVWALLRRQPEGRPHRERTWRGFAAPTRLTEPDQALREAARELASRRAGRNRARRAHLRLGQIDDGLRGRSDRRRHDRCTSVARASAVCARTSRTSW